MACNDGPCPDPAPFTDLIRYKADLYWEDVNNKEIDITEMPESFNLTFRSTGLTGVRAECDGEDISCELLDPISYDDSTGEIIGEPTDSSYLDGHDRFYYTHHVEITSKAKKITLFFYQFTPIESSHYFCSTTLVRK